MAADFDRRELLAGVLGLPLAALAGCARNKGVALPPAGEILGASHELGHRLRGPLKIELPADQYESVDVLIVGAGVAGLAAARALKEAGVESFALVELESVAGGTSRGGQSGSLMHPWGAHYLPAPMKENKALISLLDQLGVVTGFDAQGEPQFAEEMLCRDPEERIFANGAWHEGLWPSTIATSEDEQHLQKFHREVEHWIAWRDGQGRRAFTLPVSACSDDAEVTALDRQSFAQWLDQRGLTSRCFRWWVEYATRDDYGLTLSQTSAWAGLFYFASRMREKANEPQPLLTWPEGNGWLVKQLAADVQKHLRTDIAVVSIRATENAPAEVLALSRDGAPRGYRARQVIFAAPHFLAPYVIKEFPQERRRFTQEFQYGAWLVANLALTARPANVGFEPAWDNVLYDSLSLGYVSATHQRGRDQGPTVLTWYYPLTDDDPAKARERLLGMTWGDCAELTIADLQRAHPDLFGLVSRLDVMRWGHAMIQPRIGFMTSAARKSEREPWRNVHFAHSDLSGIALFEEAFDHGDRVGKSVAEALKGAS